MYAPSTHLSQRIAENLRKLRHTRGLSLGDIADRCGVSRAGISQIETAKTNPTVSMLSKIAGALDVPISALLGDEAIHEVHILRGDARRTVRSADGRLEGRPLSPRGALANVDVFELRLPSHASSVSEPQARGTMENLVVLSGALRLRVGEQVCELATGDSVSFHADVPHTYENPGCTEARYHEVIVYGRTE
jgi:transcriptional regulator with XRE-family HTH domain